VVIDKGKGKELKKGILYMVGQGCKGLPSLGRQHSPPELQRAAWCHHPCLTPPRAEVAATSCTLCLFPQGAGCQAGVAGRSRSPVATGNLLPPLCVCGLPYISLAPKAFVEKGSPC